MTITYLRRSMLVAAVFATTAVSMPSVARPQSDEVEDKAEAGQGRAAAARRARKAAEERTAAASDDETTHTAAAVPSKYPNASRNVPAGKASAKGSKKLQAMLAAFNADKAGEARTGADAVIADESSNPFEKAFAAQLAAQTAIGAQDYPAALKYVDLAIAQNSLDNDAHFGLMLQRAQLYMIQKNYPAALTAIEQYLAESRATDPESQVIRGNALYRLTRYADAAAVLKPVVEANPNHPDWQQLLADALARSGNAAEATRFAEAAASTNPADKQARFNLVQTYLQNKQPTKAAQLLQDMRKAGQLTDDADYRQLFSIYANVEGKEADTIEVINEGLGKGVLKPDYSVYLALAQSYYFSHQVDKAIESYRKAAPLGKDGAAYLALAGVLRNEQRIPEAKTAAQEALKKGLQHPEDAKKILALPGK